MGSYLVTTTDAAGVVNYHLVPVEQNGQDEVFEDEGYPEITLLTTSDDQSLQIYGTGESDLFEYDYAYPDVVRVNGCAVNLSLISQSREFQFVGLGGDDRLELRTTSDTQLLAANDRFVLVRGANQKVYFSEVESTEVFAADTTSRIKVLDSLGDDSYLSFPSFSTMQFPEHTISFRGFGRVDAYSRNGEDVARLYGGVLDGLVRIDRNYLRADSGGEMRRALDFPKAIYESNDGVDEIRLVVRDQGCSVKMSLDSIEYKGADSLQETRIEGVSKGTIVAAEGADPTVELIGDDGAETLYVSEFNSAYFGGDAIFNFNRHIRRFISENDSPGVDKVVYYDSSGDDLLSISGDSGVITGAGPRVAFRSVDRVIAVSRAGGEDSAEVDSPTAKVRLVGPWNE